MKSNLRLKNIINECVKRVLKEAKKDSFSYEDLYLLMQYSYHDAYTYCLEELGPTIGEGSSRAVFQIDDEKCLKLAMNNNGLAQNRIESFSNQMNSPLFPYVYKVGPKYAWLESEAVYPATEEDICQCLGLKDLFEFYKVINLIKRIKYNKDNEKLLDIYYAKDKYGMLKELKKYILDYDIPIGDILRLANWGLAKRNGKEYLVILDVGWNKESMKMYGGMPSA